LSCSNKLFNHFTFQSFDIERLMKVIPGILLCVW
jgi:hypothetical protein